MDERRSPAERGGDEPADAALSDDNTRVDLRDPAAALPKADRDAVPPGTRINRYMVVEIVGSGGIGIVYSAYDPDLDRKVALKLLRRSKLDGDAAAVNQRRGRLRREAQALARLSHPNVIPVYEVATFDDQIYVAMEFVEGSTLREWLGQGPRTWSEIVALFVQAGRGLAAAHAADIVHRDFKPDNVRVGADGRVRVLDFGLAGPLREGDPDLARTRAHELVSRPDSGEFHSSDEIGFEEAVTREGQVMGTPAYMSPEQAAGGLVDPRSDQFSFCVAFYEALYGARPFRGRFDDPRRFRNLSRARTLPGSRPEDLPSEIEDTILRGLSVRPEKRFPDMDALLSELTNIAAGPRRLWWVPISIMVLAVVAVVAFYERRVEAPVVCEDGSERLVGVWDEAAIEGFHETVARSRQPYAEETWATVRQSIDSWATRWRRSRKRACEATHVHGEQSPALLERRVACLDLQLVRLESMIVGLHRLDREPEALLERLTEVLGRLPSPESCAAATVLDRGELDPGELERTTTADSIRQQLAQADGLADAGDYEGAVTLGRAALDRARALDFEPVTAEALFSLGTSVDLLREDLDRGAALLEEAVWTAERSGHDALVVRSAAALIANTSQGAQLDHARIWAGLAESALVRHGQDAELEADLNRKLGDLATTEGDYEQAIAHIRRALELNRDNRVEGHPDYIEALRAIGDAERELGRFDDAAGTLSEARLLAAAKLGAKHPTVATTLDALGNVRAAQNHFAEALELHRASLAINREVFGPGSRQVAGNFNNMAIIYDKTGRYADAVATLERAREILVGLVGPEHPDVAYVDVNLGSALQNINRDEDAIARYEAALTVLEHSLGPQHMAVGVTLQNLGSARSTLGHHAEALEDYARSQAVLVHVFGGEHPSIAALELNRAKSLRALDRYDEALAADQRALIMRESLFGRDHAELVVVLTGLVETELALGHPERAREYGERAVRIAGKDNAPTERAAAKHNLARAIIAANGDDDIDRARAETLAREALTELETAEGGDALRASLEAWLRALEPK